MKIIDTVLGTIKRMTGATAEWAKTLDFRPLLNSINGLLKSIQSLTKTLEMAWNGFIRTSYFL